MLRFLRAARPQAHSSRGSHASEADARASKGQNHSYLAGAASWAQADGARKTETTMILIESDPLATPGEPRVTDRFGLLESGEELASLGQLALAVGCSNNVLRELLAGPMRKSVRWARREPAPTVYAVADARAAFEPHRAEVEARRLRAIELEATGRAARAARIAAADAANIALRSSQRPPKPTEGKSAKKAPPPRQSSPPPRAPEVIVLARRPSVRPIP